MVLDIEVENQLTAAIRDTAQASYLSLAPDVAQNILDNIEAAIDKFNELNALPIIITTPKIRPQLKKLTERIIPNLVVLSHNEISYEARLETIGTISLNNATQPESVE